MVVIDGDWWSLTHWWLLLVHIVLWSVRHALPCLNLEKLSHVSSPDSLRLPASHFQTDLFYRKLLPYFIYFFKEHKSKKSQVEYQDAEAWRILRSRSAGNMIKCLVCNATAMPTLACNAMQCMIWICSVLRGWWMPLSMVGKAEEPGT